MIDLATLNDGASKYAAGPIPVTLLTGFLGSGKTTLLNQLLADPAGRQAAVLINEFGEVGLDHLLARPIEGTKVVVKNGCICCTMHEDLRTTLRGLLNARDSGEIASFDRILIETSGMSDPMPVVLTLQGDPLFRNRLRLNGIVTTVDAINGSDLIDQRRTALHQIAMADRIVLTKCDLAEAADIVFLDQKLARVAPDASRIQQPGCPDIWSEIMADVPPWASTAYLAKAQTGLRNDPLHRDEKGVTSFVIYFDDQPDWTRFAVWLSFMMHRYGPKLLRIKGLLGLPRHPGPMILHAVQNFIHPPVHLPEWPDDDDRSRLIFIVEQIGESEVRAALTAVLGTAAFA